MITADNVQSTVDYEREDVKFPARFIRLRATLIKNVAQYLTLFVEHVDEIIQDFKMKGGGQQSPSQLPFITYANVK